MMMRKQLLQLMMHPLLIGLLLPHIAMATSFEKYAPRMGSRFLRGKPELFRTRSNIDKITAERREEIRREINRRLGGGRKLWNPKNKRSYGTLSLTSKICLANIAMFTLQTISPSITKLGVKRSDLILQGKDLYRLITPIFLHGSVTHIAMNLFSLQNIGPEVEKFFGQKRFLATYIVSGISGNLLSAYMNRNPSLGASGAVFGLMGAYFAFFNRNENVFGTNSIERMSSVGVTMAMNIGIGIMSPGIDNWGHIGGLMGGAYMAIAFGPKLYVAAFPDGSRMLVDKPLVTLPKNIKSLPQKLGEGIHRAKVRMQVDRY